MSNYFELNQIMEKIDKKLDKLDRAVRKEDFIKCFACGKDYDLREEPKVQAVDYKIYLCKKGCLEKFYE